MDTKNKTKIKSIGVLCSGGDSPGMNCAIRAVVRTGIGLGLNMYGIKRGFQGILEGDIVPMDASSVGNIIQFGGTILKTSRCLDFHDRQTDPKDKNNISPLYTGGDIIINMLLSI